MGSLGSGYLATATVASSQRATAEVARAYEYCRRITKARARNFYYAFLSLPHQKRLAVYAVYAFCRACDDIADNEGNVKDKLVRLNASLRDLTACFQGNPSTPIFVALQDAVERYHVPRALFEEIVTGVQMDLTFRRYASFEDLYNYCYRVASAVGLITIEIFGYSGEAAKQHAVDLGIAMQLVNILRDVKEDAARDRIYLPLKDLARFDYTEQELLAGKVDGRFREVMQFEAERAREYFGRGAALLPLVSLDARACPATLCALYSRLLDRMEARRWDVFSGRVSLPTSQKVWLATKIWTQTAFRRAHPAGTS